MSDLHVRSSAVVDGPRRQEPSALRLRRPSWRDRRLVAGLVLVLASTVLGARLLADDSATAPVWVAAHDLAAGSVLEEGDLEPRAMHLPGSAERYLDARAPVPAGRTLAAPVRAGELLPAMALTPEDVQPDTRTVSVPVEQWHMPSDLRRGERVDVYVTPDGAGPGSAATTEVVASDVVVAGVEGDERRFGAGGSSEAVLLTVPQGDVARLVGGLARGSVDVVRVPAGADVAEGER